MENRGYFLGLDMGTSSVGWAVTDENYHLLRAKGKDLWGIREFDEAQTAVDRRTHRITRRRRQRETVRIGMIKEYFHDAIMQVDSCFYQRLENSKYHYADKEEAVRDKNGIFHDPDYTDKEYFAQYPTIFHLRKELLESDQEHDVRLVYLAILYMFKHRGHFLNVSIGDVSGERKMSEIYGEFCDLTSNLLDLSFYLPNDCRVIEDILSERDCSRKGKAEKLADTLQVTSKEKQKRAMINCICGLNVDLKAIYGESAEIETDKKVTVCFSNAGYEEKSQEILEILGDERFELILIMKKMYDTGSLAGIMKGFAYLSEARVAQYEKHGSDLKILKGLMKKYCSKEAYDYFFRSSEDGTYSAYVNSTNVRTSKRRDMKGRTQENLYKAVSKLVNQMPLEDEMVQYVKAEIEKETFLPKQLTASNGVIPNQVHLSELKKILENAQGHLPFLKSVDESGLTVSERIIRLFSFQIPYYLGPLSGHSESDGGNGWVVRREQGQILPWNLEEKVDIKKTAEKFITKMVRCCTYMNGEYVLPKGSLLYEKFCVLNEINNIRVYGEKISVKVKQDIYNDLFKRGKKVTRKQIYQYLLGRGMLGEGEIEQLTGIDSTVNSYLATYGKFINILGEELNTDAGRNMVEDIVFWCTVYGDAKKFLREQMEEKYGERLNKDQIKRIVGLKFKDWGRLSKTFLEMQGCSKRTGEILPLISMLWETNDNLMELLAKDDYTYREELEKYQEGSYKTLAEIRIEDLDEMYFSMPVKRMVWQTLSIIKEIEKIMGGAPERLFVEMTREEEKVKSRKASRKQQFLDLYKNIKDEEHDWKSIIAEADEKGTLRSKKMFLYLTQKGRSMYTGKTIDLDDLFNDNLYDIDHIYPRHFVKDDNLSNNLVLVEKELNAHKSDNYPLEHEIYTSQLAMWKELHRQHLISDEKLKRLTGRNPFTDEQKAGFIARQLVETSQGAKGVTAILQNVLPDTKIVYAKASNVSEFRKSRGFLKTRAVNDFHHAQDAYLNIVVGNVYYVKFTQNPLHFIQREYAKDGKKYNYNLSRMFDWDVIRGNETAWIAGHGKQENGTIVTVRKMMKKNTPLLTRLSSEGHGGIADQTLYSAKKASGVGYIPLKEKDTRMHDVTKYGGFNSVSTAYYILVEHGKEGKRIRTLETVPVLWNERIEKNPNLLQEYCEKELGLTDPSIRMKKIKMQSLIKKDGYYMHLSGKTGNQIYVRNAIPVCLEQKWLDYIKNLEKGEKAEKITLEKNEELYDILCGKHSEGIFRRKPNPMGEKLEKGKQMFEKLTCLEQGKVLLEILNLTRIGVTSANLALIGGNTGTGVMRISKKITGAQEFVLVNQSVTGVYENRIDLLTV